MSYDSFKSRGVLNRAQQDIAAVSALPKEETQKKVFHYSWEVESYILYLRPNYKILDLLDPYFMKKSDAIFNSRYDIANGKYQDNYEF